MLVLVTAVTTNMTATKACAVEFAMTIGTAYITALVVLSVVMLSCQSSAARGVDDRWNKADSSGSYLSQAPAETMASRSFFYNTHMNK